MSIPRVPRDSDPRRPPRRDGEAEESGQREGRSYGQSAPVPELLDEFEEVTGEVAREGDEPDAGDDKTGAAKRKTLRQLEEFEELTEEPVREEDPR
jgi:hypothetical protein